MMGLGLLPTDHEMNIGMIGAQGSKTANYALAHNDLLLLIGSRAADRAIPNAPEIAKRTKIIHFDVDPAEIGKNMAGSLPVIGDLKVVLGQILEVQPKADDEAWVGELRERRDKEAVKTTITRDGCVTPRFLMQELGRQLDDDAYVCVDVGQNQIWAARDLPLKNGRFLTTGGSVPWATPFRPPLASKWPCRKNRRLSLQVTAGSRCR
jgi:acetolactate synthase-1/2/3 large subunit